MRVFLNQFKTFFTTALSLVLFFRICFYFLNGLYPIKWLFIGIGYDILFCLSLYGIFFPLTYVLFRISPRLNAWFNFALLGILIFLHYATEIFFFTQNTRLGSSIMFYSNSELITISRTGKSNSLTATLITISCFVIAALVYSRIRRLKIGRIGIWISLLIVVTLSQFLFSNFLFGKSYEPSPHISNKVAYLINSLISENTDETPAHLIGNFSFPSSFENRDYFDKEYPLAYRDSLNRSKLSPFFKSSTAPPDVVIIIVESLSRYISGEESTYPSLTPFLDSLSHHSLVWNNCISSSERTFGVLPGILGSLPYGKHGFSYLAGRMPQHISLVNVLEKNGYKSNFYYGGEIGFDNTEVFLNRERFSHIESSDYIKKDGLVYWGLTDSLLFENSIQNYHTPSPQLHVYLTLSTHGPYDFEGKEQIQEYLKNTVILSQNHEKLNEIFNKDPDLCGSFYYTDQQVKHLINKLKKTPKFENTIFIITGDHGLPLDKNDNELKRYHVPLLIYSPLLSRTKRIHSLVSHLDIFPSIQKLLKQNYALKIPEVNHAIGEDLDTLASFSANRQIPLLSGNRSIHSFVKDSIFMSNEVLFEIKDNLNDFIEVSDITKLDTISKELESFKNIDFYVCKNDKLIPTNYAKDWSTIYKRNYKGEIEIEKPESEFIGIIKEKGLTKSAYVKIEIDLTFTDSLIDKEALPEIILSLNDENANLVYIAKKIIEEHETFPSDSTLTQSIALETYIPPTSETQKEFSINVYLWNSNKTAVPIESISYGYYTAE